MPHPHQPFGVGLAVAAVAAVYVAGWRRLGTRSPGLPSWRPAAFFLGLATLWATLGSPLASCDSGSLTGHMIQHLLLMTLVPPLVLLGEPVKMMVGGLRGFGRNFEHRLGGRTSVRAAVACWLAGSGTLVLWHVPAVFSLAARSPAWHAVEQASFLVAGLVFWWPVIEPWPGRPLPSWSIVLYLFLATLPCDILSAFLVFSDRIAYSVYGSSDLVLADQQRAGALMWTAVTLVYLVVGTLVSARLLRFGDSPDLPTKTSSVAPSPPRRAVRPSRAT
jgi:cytochrome c oxidase assembly factor CtaG